MQTPQRTPHPQYPEINSPMPRLYLVPKNPSPRPKAIPTRRPTALQTLSRLLHVIRRSLRS
jgi:hypothetical protein